MGCTASREGEGGGAIKSGGEEDGRAEDEMQLRKRRQNAEDEAAERAAAEFDDDEDDEDHDSLDGDMPGEVEMNRIQPRATLAVIRGPTEIDNPHSEGNRFIDSNML